MSVNKQSHMMSCSCYPSSVRSINKEDHGPCSLRINVRLFKKYLRQKGWGYASSGRLLAWQNAALSSSHSSEKDKENPIFQVSMLSREVRLFVHSCPALPWLLLGPLTQEQPSERTGICSRDSQTGGQLPALGHSGDSTPHPTSSGIR
jgi:hypothetical protein